MFLEVSLFQETFPALNFWLRVWSYWKIPIKFVLKAFKSIASIMKINYLEHVQKESLRKKCPYSEIFLVCIFIVFFYLLNFFHSVSVSINPGFCVENTS